MTIMTANLLFSKPRNVRVSVNVVSGNLDRYWVVLLN